MKACYAERTGEMFLRDISESCIWTDRMLATLVKGVKRGK